MIEHNFSIRRCHLPLQNLNTVDSYPKMSAIFFTISTRCSMLLTLKQAKRLSKTSALSNHFGKTTHNTRCTLSRRCADLLRRVASLYRFDTLQKAAPMVSITSTRCHTHATWTETSSSYRNVDTSYSFEPEMNQVPSKGKVGVFVTLTRLDVSSTPRSETRSSEMSVILYNFSTRTVQTQRSHKLVSEGQSILCPALCIALLCV